MPKVKIRRKRRKITKFRGKRYSGYGQVSGGHRGKGQRGGFGRAGIKDHMKTKYLKEGHRFGSRGFTRHGPFRPDHPINIGRLVELALSGVIDVSKEDNKLVIDASKLPYTKILGGGRVVHPVKIILAEDVTITENAKEKVLAAGGEIIEAKK
mgnify:CR=1 FL=1